MLKVKRNIEKLKKKLWLFVNDKQINHDLHSGMPDKGE